MKHKNILWLLVGLMLCSGCGREYLTYDSKAKDRLYMLDQDTLHFYFDKLDLRDSVEMFSDVYVLGMPVDYDRVVNVRIIDSLTTAKEGVHFFMRNVVIKAGEVTGKISWTFFRTRDPKLEDRCVVVGFCLNKNENFDLLPGQDSCVYYYKIGKYKVDIPAFWNESYLGPYSEGLYAAFLDQYLKLESTNPNVYRILTENYGYKLTEAGYNLWGNHEYMVVRYIVHPLYDYYEANPDSEVNIPTPKF